MNFEKHLISENKAEFKKTATELSSMGRMRFLKKYGKGFDKFVAETRKNGNEKKVLAILNKGFKTKMTSLDEVKRASKKMSENLDTFETNPEGKAMFLFQTVVASIISGVATFFYGADQPWLWIPTIMFIGVSLWLIKTDKE